MTIEFEAVIEAIATRHGVTTGEVLREMECALDVARANPDPAAQQRQMEVFPAGLPAAEEFILTMAGKLR